MKNRRSFRSIAVSLAVLAVVGAWYLRSRGDDESQDSSEAERGSDPALLLDRVWVDSKPEKYTDYVQVMLAVSYAPIGIFQRASAYQNTAELFEHRRRDARLALHFPQTGKKREMKFRIWTCNDLPPFDLCLEVNKNPWGGPRRYYGLSDPDKERAELGDLRHQLEHRVTTAAEAGGHSDGAVP
jgi:hypothetical protein